MMYRIACSESKNFFSPVGIHSDIPTAADITIRQHNARTDDAVETARRAKAKIFLGEISRRNSRAPKIRCRHHQPTVLDTQRCRHGRGPESLNKKYRKRDTLSSC